MNQPRYWWVKFLFLIGITFWSIVLWIPKGWTGQAKEALAPAGSVYYVSTAGDDSNSGLAGHPWKTIQKAANTMVAGDTVYIRAGTYPEQVRPQNSGSPGSYITYAAYPGETPVIDGVSITLIDDLVGLFQIYDKQYIRVVGLRVINAGPHVNNNGILVDRSSHIILERNHTYLTMSSGIGVWASDHITVDGNKVERACIDIYQECLTVAETTSFVLKNNEVFDCQEEGIDVKDNSWDGQVYGNHVHHVDSTGLYIDSWNRVTHDIDVFQNIIHDIGDNGIAVASEDGGTLYNIHLYNNLSYNNRFVGISIAANGIKGPIRDIYITNNTLYNNGWEDWGGGILVDNPDTQRVFIRNNITSQNLYFQIAVNPGLAAENVTITHNLVDGYRNHGDEGETWGTNFIQGDPLFYNVPSANFRLQASSPAIDTGTALDAPNTDFDGRTRPLDGDGNGSTLFDIGAFEMPYLSEWLYLCLIMR